MNRAHPFSRKSSDDDYHLIQAIKTYQSLWSMIEPKLSFVQNSTEDEFPRRRISEARGG